MSKNKIEKEEEEGEIPMDRNRENMERFLMSPGHKEKHMLCYIIRDRSESKAFPQYKLYTENGGIFLLSARKRKKSKSSNYLISLNPNDLSRSSEFYFGKVIFLI